MIINTPAIVLKSFPYGDTSLIARCFSKDNGKISLIIKGARSKKSSKTSQFQPLSYIDIIYQYKPNRKLQTLTKVDILQYWSKIIDDLHKISLSMAILELTDRTLSDNDSHPELFTVLVKLFQSYNDKCKDPNLLFWFYECALLTHLGFRPSLEEYNLPGLHLPDPNSGPHSGLILASLFSGYIKNLPSEKITKIDRKIINNYLWLSLCYHFENLHDINSMKIAKKLLI